jgi:IS6 family transposase
VVWAGAVATCAFRVKGRRCYLYRAIDSRGATIDLLLSALRDADAAKRLFRKALGDRSHPQPRVVLLLKLGLVAMGLPQS